MRGYVTAATVTTELEWNRPMERDPPPVGPLPECQVCPQHHQMSMWKVYVQDAFSSTKHRKKNKGNDLVKETPSFPKMTSDRGTAESSFFFLSRP
jgi:hypothetical protein